MGIGRRIIGALLAGALSGGTASAAVIGVVAPQSGPYALLGQQIRAGARAAATVGGDRLVEIDERCDEGDGADTARALIDAKTDIAIGFLCVETLTTALPALKTAHIPAVSVSVRSKILMEDALRNDWPFFRIAPAESAEDHSADSAEKCRLTVRWLRRSTGRVCASASAFSTIRGTVSPRYWTALL